MQSENKAPALSLKPNLDRNAIGIILWNLFPVFGVLFLGWQPISVFICYAMETVVVGIFNVFRLFAVYRYGLPPQPGETGVAGLGIIPFFLVHYFFFVFVQLSIFFSIVGSNDFGPFSLLWNIAALLKNNSYQLALGVFLLNNIYWFTNDFLFSNKFKERSMGEQMFEPYPRIFVQQFVVILSGFFFTLAATGYPVLVVFVAVKIYFDLLFNGLNLSNLALLKKPETQ